MRLLRVRVSEGMPSSNDKKLVSWTGPLHIVPRSGGSSSVDSADSRFVTIRQPCIRVRVKVSMDRKMQGYALLRRWIANL